VRCSGGGDDSAAGAAVGSTVCSAGSSTGVSATGGTGVGASATGGSGVGASIGAGCGAGAGTDCAAGAGCVAGAPGAAPTPGAAPALDCALASGSAPVVAISAAASAQKTLTPVKARTLNARVTQRGESKGGTLLTSAASRVRFRQA